MGDLVNKGEARRTHFRMQKVCDFERDKLGARIIGGVLPWLNWFMQQTTKASVL